MDQTSSPAAARRGVPVRHPDASNTRTPCARGQQLTVSRTPRSPAWIGRSRADESAASQPLPRIYRHRHRSASGQKGAASSAMYGQGIEALIACNLQCADRDPRPCLRSVAIRCSAASYSPRGGRCAVPRRPTSDLGALHAAPPPGLGLIILLYPVLTTWATPQDPWRHRSLRSVL